HSRAQHPHSHPGAFLSGSVPEPPVQYRPFRFSLEVPRSMSATGPNSHHYTVPAAIPEGMQEVRVRFSPSPTGSLHIGGAKTAMYDYLFAKGQAARAGITGSFVLRIEDTDQKRYVEGAVDGLMDGLKWLGLEWDEGPDKDGEYGPYVQS